ncbi:MAG: hypothetical protein REI96_07130 [Flavobacterium nitrogenifigens]|uniref:hypothetical protein n=1 Tax=Flavobacterium nitrogenifigens TaxID=1617283 RepID=UPI002807B6FF|nr:hypothetical protein [Flavobacterium nitrogenifigens]MDQ8012202.1 hypothetical protein [Flavobacterium nitrogenifigens]
MTDFLRKIHLVKDISIQLPVSKIDFIQKFSNNVDESDLYFSPFEIFESSNNEYKGFLLDNYFEIRKRRKFFDANYSFAKVSGTFTENNNQIHIDAEINGLQHRMILLFAVIFIFYSIFIINAFLSADSKAPFIILPIILVHMSLMFGIPYFVIRRTVNRASYDIERDFHYWVTKN